MTGPGTEGTAVRVGRVDNVRFTAIQIIPQLLRGMFKRRPRMASLVDRWDPDPQGIGVVRSLRKRYGSDHLWLSLLGKPSLLVLDLEGIRHVLDHSPEIYGPQAIKVRGMSHFQPDAATVSDASTWGPRRTLNDAVLVESTPGHARAREVLEAVDAVVPTLLGSGRATLALEDVQHAFRALTARVVFGPDVDAEPVLTHLDDLMARANRIAGETDTPERRAFHEGLRERIRDPRAGGLAAEACPHMQPGDPLPVAGQMPHWLFAMKDTLALNAFNTLALVAARPEAQERARQEAAATDPTDPAAVDGMAWVEGCLLDTMRLWPTTPLLVREVAREDQIGGDALSPGDQVIIHNGHNHRNPDAMDDPDGFHPEAWEPGSWNYWFNFMSNGPQGCAGRDLAVYLAKAFLARLLADHSWRHRRPTLSRDGAVPHAFDPRGVVLEGVG